MKKSIVLFLLLVLSGSIAHAGIFDWITGKATGATVSEQVKCVFANSQSMQTCYTDDGMFKCSGTDACIADVSGSNGNTLRWKSSCGGEFYTIIDGSSDSIEFKCEQIQTTTQAQEVTKTKPDLVIDSILTDISTITTSDKVTIKVGIKNNGNIDVPAGTDVVVYITPNRL